MEKKVRTATVSESSARLSKYLDRVRAGEEFVITRRGTPVARLAPISRKKTRRNGMASLESRGVIRLGSGKLPKDFWTIPKPEDPGGSVLEALLEDRKGGR
jgi:prevent-host-death family protein